MKYTKKYICFNDDNGTGTYMRIPLGALPKLRKMRARGKVRNMCCNVKRGYFCTRRIGHDGYHVAHTTDRDPCAFWK